MIQITGRIFDGNEVIGYQVTDGVQYKEISKQQAWLFAKEGRIQNVEATGTEDNMGLSGTNGFTLRSLPEIKVKKNVENYMIFSAGARASMKGAIKIGEGNPPVQHSDLKKLWEKYLQNEISTGEVNLSTMCSMSDYFTILDVLGDPDRPQRRIVSDKGNLYRADSYVKVGYKIRYTGTVPFETYRVPIKNESNLVPFTIQPGQEVYLSRADVAALCANPLVGGKLSNAYFICKHSDLASGVIIFRDEWLEKMNNRDMLNVKTVVDEETLYTYFLKNKKSSETDKKVPIPTVFAYGVHKIIESGDTINFKDKNFITLFRNMLKSDINAGKVDVSTLGVSKNELELLYRLRAMNKCLGYTFKYNGKAPLEIQRINISGNSPFIETSIIMPGDEISLSKAETCLLLSKPEFSGYFKGGYGMSKSKSQFCSHFYENTNDILDGFRLIIEDHYTYAEYKSLYKVVDKNTIYTYFLNELDSIPSKNISGYADDLPKKDNTVISGFKDIMNMFKRN